MDAIIETGIRGLVSFMFLMLVTMGVLMLKRTLKGEKSFTDRDWRLLFGKPKAEVLTVRFVRRLGVAFVACLFVGLVLYLVLAPYGIVWYGLGAIVTALAIVLVTPRVLG